MANEVRTFFESPKNSQKNRRVFRRLKIAPAVLVNRERGALLVIDGQMVVFSRDEVVQFTNKLIDVIEGKSIGDD